MNALRLIASPWKRNSRLRVAAVGMLSALACWQTATAQVPMPTPAAPVAQSKPADVQVKGYSVGSADLQWALDQLQADYRSRSDVRVAADPRTRQIVLVAPADVHKQVERWVADLPATIRLTQQQASENGLTTRITPLPQESVDSSMGELVSYRLRNTGASDFEQLLTRLGARRVVTTASSTNSSEYELRSPKLPPVRLKVDRRAGEVQVSAPKGQGRAWEKLLGVLDWPRDLVRDQAAVVPLEKADPMTVARAISLIKAAGMPTTAEGKREHIGEFMTMIFQPGADGGAAPPAAPPAEGPAVPPPAVPGGEAAPEEGAAADDGLGRIGDVQIEFLEGLDVMVVRGKKADVERVLKIIDEIERQSEETKPVVEIYTLKNVDGRALSDLVATIYDQVFSARQSRVTITPLVKPNALMLIGRAEAIPPVVELLQKLDQTVSPESQLKVFRLKFMSSIDAERTVRNFFVDRPGFGTDPRTGLGTRVLTIAEYRTNSLIVQASQRDLLEVQKLLDTLDVAASESANEVRIFKLKNAVAEELAPVLQEAVTGQIQGAGQQQGQQQQQQGQGGQGAQTPATATRRSTNLQLLRVDSEGRGVLESGILSDMRITADPRGNSIVVTGPTQSMPLMQALIEQMDALPATEAQIKVFTIENGDATALAETLQNLFGQQQQGGGQNQGQFGLQTATGAGDSSLVPLRFSVDTRTNSIVASGTTGDLNVVYQILVRLDEGDIRQRVTTVYRLRNSPAADVATAINELLTNQRDLSQQNAELTTQFEQFEREVIVVPEIVSNSLIVSATPRYFDEIKKVVEDLDRRPPMVIIQVMIAEVLLSDVEQLGVELGIQDSLLFDRGIGSVGFPFNNVALGNNSDATSLATRESVAGQGLSSFGVGRTDPTLGYGGLVLSASSESVSVLVRALQQSRRLQVISRPQVQTLDNQPAFVQVGARVPRITSSQLTVNGTINNTVLENVGIILGVTPRTAPDGMIVMEIDAEKSELGPEAEGIPISINSNGDVIRSPQIRIATAQTTVSARSGQTVIIGGLITKNQQESTRRVPYLGDIPVLGRLFRFDSVSDERRELLIILTPFIMQNDEDIEWMNMRESERMSWCMADVVNIHGDVLLGSGPQAPASEASPLIFPDNNPSAPQLTPPGVYDPQAPTPATPSMGQNSPPPGPNNGMQPPSVLRPQQIQPVAPVSIDARNSMQPPQMNQPQYVQPAGGVPYQGPQYPPQYQPMMPQPMPQQQGPVMPANFAAPPGGPSANMVAPAAFVPQQGAYQVPPQQPQRPVQGPMYQPQAAPPYSPQPAIPQQTYQPVSGMYR